MISRKLIFCFVVGIFLLSALTVLAVENDSSTPLTIGNINLDSASMLFATAVLSFIDGINPYSLWGLVFLLGIVTTSGSRKKIIIVGLTYLLVTGITYGLMMLGLLNFFSKWGYQDFIRIGVGLIAATFAMLNIWDYFKKKIEATIVTSHRQSILRQKMTQIMDPHHHLAILIIGTMIIALGITILEFPLSFSLPMIWANLITRHQVSALMFALLLLLYLLIYLGEEIIVFVSMFFAMGKTKMNPDREQALKLIGGIIILSLAFALIFNLEMMNTMTGSLILFGFSAIIGTLVAFLFGKIKTK